MTDLVGRVRALDADATPAPWEHEDGPGNDLHFGVMRFQTVRGAEQSICSVATNRAADFALIAEYRTLAPALADRVEELEAENKRLTAVLGEGTE